MPFLDPKCFTFAKSSTFFSPIQNETYKFINRRTSSCTKICTHKGNNLTLEGSDTASWQVQHQWKQQNQIKWYPFQVTLHSVPTSKSSGCSPSSPGKKKHVKTTVFSTYNIITSTNPNLINYNLTSLGFSHDSPLHFPLWYSHDISNGAGLDPTSPWGPLGRPHMSPQGLLVCLLATKRSAQPKVHLTSATKPGYTVLTLRCMLR